MTTSSYIIFDLDETIGQFIQLGHFYKCLIKYYKKIPTKNDFFNLLNRCTKYFRPRMFEIFNHIKLHKISNKNLKVLIYTNNQGGLQWINKIKDFIEFKIQYKLFDKIVGPYKIKNEIKEILRTTDNKCFSDLVKILDCNNKTSIMFLDDKFYGEMLKDNIVYLLVKPYNYFYKIDELISIYTSYNNIENINNFIEFIKLNMSLYREYSSKNYISVEDVEMSDDIMEKIQDFLFNIKYKKSHKKTIKIHKNRSKNKTLKRR